jgi:hypothetical protein
MSKRSAKKRIVTGIAAAIDQLLISTGDDDRQFDEKTQSLFNVYDAAMARINAVGKLKGRAEVKEHFRKLYADVQAEIVEIIGKK